MTKHRTVWRIAASFAIVVVGVGPALVLAQRTAEPQQADTAPQGAWQPPKQDRSAYLDIVDYNIFRSDRQLIAERVDRQRNPPEPRDDTPRELAEVDADKPTHPDALWRLAGISHNTENAVAYIEHVKTGELTRIKDTAEIASGKVTAIGYDAILYTAEGRERVVNIGQTLRGERVAPADNAGANTKASSGSGETAADRLRALRERRAKELGQDPPPAEPDRAQTPQPQETPEPQDSSDPRGPDDDPQDDEDTDDDEDEDIDEDDVNDDEPKDA